MYLFNSSLLREKFVIQDEKNSNPAESATIALSNRFVVELRNPQHPKDKEVFIVRGHNMHSVIRMAARIIHDFTNGGPIANRQNRYKWENVWDAIVNDYEFAYNPDRWIAIYKDGKCVFTSGDHHPFLDLIEKCDHDNNKDYDYAIPLAEKLFEQTGKSVKIVHDANVALSVNFEREEARLGIILRGSNKTTTFSFAVRPKKAKDYINIPQCLAAAAAFLEGIQLAFLVGMNTEKMRIRLIERFSKEEKQTKDGRRRLNRLIAEITSMETAFDVRYRPEKPDFELLVTEAEELGQKILEPPPEKPEGDIDEEQAEVGQE